MIELLLFEIEKQNFAIDIKSVSSVIPFVTITPLPDAPPFIMGAINVHGKVISVINMRKIMKFPKQECRLLDQMIICQDEQNTTALYIDKAHGVFAFSENELSAAPSNHAYTESIVSVIRQENQLIFVYDPKKLLEMAGI